jgi:hypothetical protein
LEKLGREEIQQEMLAQGKTRVYQYWKQETDHNKWRIWNTLTPQNRDQTTTTIQEVEEELGKRKITVAEGMDQLRWGHKDGREFNLKEVRHYIMNQDQEDLVQQWVKL